MFHRRYGLEDTGTIVLTVIQLFIVLFYVYPLKFLSVWLTDIFVLRRGPTVTITHEDMPSLMMMYGIGWMGIYGIFFLLYRKANSMNSALELSEIESAITRGNIRSHLISILIGLASVFLAFISKFTHPVITLLSGVIYSLMGPFQYWNGARIEKEIKRIETKQADKAEENETGSSETPQGSE